METYKLSEELAIKPPFKFKQVNLIISDCGRSLLEFTVLPQDYEDKFKFVYSFLEFAVQALNEKAEREYGEPLYWVKCETGTPWTFMQCPKCNEKLWIGFIKKDCPHCGQKLLLPEDKGENNE